MIQSETYLRAKKQCALVDQLLESSFPQSGIQKLEKTLEAFPKDQDPRALFEKACKRLQRVTNDLGNSILHEAVLKGEKSLCRLFVQQGLFQAKNYEEETPLHLAIRVDSAYALSMLIHDQRALLAENKFSQTPLELALSLDRIHFVKRILRKAASLDEIIPKHRQRLFFTALWEKKDTTLLELVAKRFFAHSVQESEYVLDFSEENGSSLIPWILNGADSLQFSLSDENWDLLLLHVLGKHAYHFVKDGPHLQEGTWDKTMYVPLLWTWRAFCQSKEAPADPLFLQIDKAIASAIDRPPSFECAQKIRKGQEPVILRSGWEGHSTTVVFCNRLMFICNCGEQADEQEYDLTVYRINNNRVTSRIVKQIKACDVDSVAKSGAYLFETLPELLQGFEDRFCKKMHTMLQPAALTEETCVAKNLRVAIRAILLANNRPLSLYQEYVQFARYAILEQYLMRLRA